MHKLNRSKTDKILLGVCGGLGEYFEIDSVLVRLVFILFSLVGGGGILLYLLLAVIIPKSLASEQEADTVEKIKEFARKAGETVGDFAKEIGHGAKTSAEPIKESKGNRKISFFGIILVIFGFFFLMNELMPAYWMGRRFFWPFLLMFFGFYLIFRKGEGCGNPRHLHSDVPHEEGHKKDIVS